MASSPRCRGDAKAVAKESSTAGSPALHAIGAEFYRTRRPSERPSALLRTRSRGILSPVLSVPAALPQPKESPRRFEDRLLPRMTKPGLAPYAIHLPC